MTICRGISEGAKSMFWGRGAKVCADAGIRQCRSSQIALGTG